ncbi:MAG: hypothetical protein R3C03_00055 [Pirellulaceae bacterium]
MTLLLTQNWISLTLPPAWSLDASLLSQAAFRQEIYPYFQRVHPSFLGSDLASIRTITDAIDWAANGYNSDDLVNQLDRDHYRPFFYLIPNRSLLSHATSSFETTVTSLSLTLNCTLAR